MFVHLKMEDQEFLKLVLKSLEESEILLDLEKEVIDSLRSASSSLKAARYSTWMLCLTPAINKALDTYLRAVVQYCLNEHGSQVSIIGGCVHYIESLVLIRKNIIFLKSNYPKIFEDINKQYSVLVELLTNIERILKVI